MPLSIHRHRGQNKFASDSASATQGSSISITGGTTAKSGSDSGLLAESGFVTTGSPVTKMIFGMYNSCSVPGSGIQDGQNPAFPNGHGQVAWRGINSTYMGGRMKVRRAFNGGMPSTWSGVGDEIVAAYTNGVWPCTSVKAPPSEVSAGTWDAAITSLANSAPNGTYWIYFHEPEDDFGATGAVAWRNAFARFYDVMKAANPTLIIGYASMCYQWRPGSASTPVPDNWYPGDTHCDFLSTDVYCFDWQQPKPLGNNSVTDSVDSGFVRWYNWASTKPKPLLVTEYAIENQLSGGFSDSVRASILADSLDFCLSVGIKMMLYWHAVNAGDQDGHTHEQFTPTTMFPTTTHPLTLAVWNDRSLVHGSTGHDIYNL